jgi:uncharacterized protein (TIGR02172 family)
MNKTFLGEPIARGRTADVYAWEGNTILKLFHEWFDLESIEYERRIVDAVNQSGVDTPSVSGLVRVEGRNGLIYQRVDGPSMLETLLRKPWRMFHLAHLLAESHIKIHNRQIESDIPSQRERLQAKIRLAAPLTDSQKELLLKRLESMPDGNRVCHGDFFPGNVLLTDKGVVAIDWIDATRGNPLADVARTCIILKGIWECQVHNQFLQWYVHWYHSIYLRRYFQLRPAGFQEYLSWLPIVAGARLSENIPELETWLMKQVELSQV